MSIWPWFTAVFIAAASCSVHSAEGAMDPNLEKLRPLIGKTFRGEFKSSKPDKPVVDVLKWERALNGKAVRSLHSINEGSYGGETIFTWDSVEKVVRYHYFTTAGFMTAGTLYFKEGKIITLEKIRGSTGSVTEVRGVSELRPDGTLHVKTEHLKEGNWSPGHEVIYREDPAAKVIFK